MSARRSGNLSTSLWIRILMMYPNVQISWKPAFFRCRLESHGSLKGDGLLSPFLLWNVSIGGGTDTRQTRSGTAAGVSGGGERKRTRLTAMWWGSLCAQGGGAGGKEKNTGKRGMGGATTWPHSRLRSSRLDRLLCIQAPLFIHASHPTGTCRGGVAEGFCEWVTKKGVGDGCPPANL